MKGIKMNTKVRVKNMPDYIAVALDKFIDAHEKYALEIFEYAAYKAIEKSTDEAAVFSTHLIGRLMDYTLQAKNVEKSNMTMIAEFLSSYPDILSSRNKNKYKDSTCIHVALHTFAFRRYGEFETNYFSSDSDKKFCDAIYEKFKDADLDKLGDIHPSYGRNKFIKPFLENLIKHYEHKAEPW